MFCLFVFKCATYSSGEWEAKYSKDVEKQMKTKWNVEQTRERDEPKIKRPGRRGNNGMCSGVTLG